MSKIELLIVIVCIAIITGGMIYAGYNDSQPRVEPKGYYSYKLRTGAGCQQPSPLDDNKTKGQTC